MTDQNQRYDLNNPAEKAEAEGRFNELMERAAERQLTALAAAKLRRLQLALLNLAKTSSDGRISEEDARACAAAHDYTDQDQIADMIARGKKTGTIRKTDDELVAEAQDRAAALLATQAALRRAIDRARAQLAGPFPMAKSKVYIVRPVELERQSNEGIILPGRDLDGRAALGLVLQRPYFTGDDYDPNVGDVVMYSRYGGQQAVLPEGIVVVLQPAEVYGVYTGVL